MRRRWFFQLPDAEASRQRMKVHDEVGTDGLVLLQVCPTDVMTVSRVCASV